MILYLIAGIAAGAVAGFLFLPKGACSDGTCPMTSGRSGGIFLGSLVGLGLGIAAFTMFGDQQKDTVGMRVDDSSVSHTTESKSLLGHAGSGDFEQAVSKGTVLVDFFATWCGPCKQQTPILEKFAQKHQGTLKIIKVNIDDSPDIARKYGVSGVPALVFFHDGKLLGGDMGLTPENKLETMFMQVKEMIAKPAEKSDV